MIRFNSSIEKKKIIYPTYCFILYKTCFIKLNACTLINLIFSIGKVSISLWIYPLFIFLCTRAIARSQDIVNFLGEDWFFSSFLLKSFRTTGWTASQKMRHFTYVQTWHERTTPCFINIFFALHAWYFYALFNRHCEMWLQNSCLFSDGLKWKIQ